MPHFFLLRANRPCGVLLALAITAPWLQACGPSFPNCYLTDSVEAIAELPTLGLEGELLRLLPPEARLTAINKAARSPKIDTEAERAEIRAALTTGENSAISVDFALSTYDRCHPSIFLPQEFQLYARGARAWADGNKAEAEIAWRELLALPQKERFYRTVWAAYMLGRVAGDEHPQLAREAFHQARKAAADGFADSQHLAEASWGWEAKTHLADNNYAEALRTYFRSFQEGDPAAVTSIQTTLHKAFLGVGYSDSRDESAPTEEKNNARAPSPASDDGLAELASDPQLRRVVTAWFVSRGGPFCAWRHTEAEQMVRWIQVLRRTTSLSSDEADRWSWAAYQSGLWDEARDFADLAPPQAPAAEWVRAMLLLRNGFVDDALTHLTQAAKAFPPDTTEPALLPQAGASNRWNQDQPEDSPAEKLPALRAVLNLRREHYTEALGLFLHAGHWPDAAYLAERVLTIEELMSFIKSDDPQPRDQDKASWFDRTDRARTAGRDLRHLLARRLVRAQRFDDARRYFPAELLPIYDSYLANCRLGFDPSRSRSERGTRFWTAAKIIYEHGIELQGTELEPDYAIAGGDFEWPDITGARTGEPRLEDKRFEREEPKLDNPLAATHDEIERQSTTKTPTQRFHYRNRAVDLAWLAAQFLPDDDARTAEILYTAGRWLAAKDPEQANRFYQSLALRCPNTDLGREAAKKHWFVKPAG